MKIAFISCTNGLVYRGVETFVHELANSLSLSNDVIVYQAGDKFTDAVYETKIISFGFNLSRENKLRSLSRPLYMDFGFKNIVRRFYLDYWNRKQGEFTLLTLCQMDKSIDVLIIPGSGWVSLFCRIWCWLNGAKLVIVGQSGPGWDDRINLWCRPDTFVALSSLAKDWALKAGFGVKIITIPNGVSFLRFNDNVKPVQINLPRPIFLSVAALEPGKRIDLTIEAISRMKSGSLVVLGDGNQKEYLQKMGKLKLPGRMLIRYVKHDEIPTYYEACDAVTMVPVGVESFGIVYVEGMAMNKPIVATDDPIRREIIGSAGLFVNPKNPDEYATALELAVKKDWGDIPKKQAEKFSWDKIAKQYEELFKTL